MRSLTKGGAHVLKPSLNKRALARLKDVTSLVGRQYKTPILEKGRYHGMEKPLKNIVGALFVEEPSH